MFWFSDGPFIRPELLQAFQLCPLIAALALVTASWWSYLVYISLGWVAERAIINAHRYLGDIPQ